MSVISLTCPISLSDRIETSNFLAAGIIFDESDIAGDVNFGLFFGNLDFLLGDRLGAEATAVADDMFRLPKECGMTMEINFTVLWLIPLRVQQQIFGVK